MDNGSVARRGAGLARTVLFSLLMLAGCAPRFGGPAPVVNGGAAASAPAPGEVVIERGQTLSGIAHRYHVPMQAIAEANHLSPPYRILAGATLIIPGEPSAPQVAMTAAPPQPPAPPMPPMPEASVTTSSLPPPDVARSRAVPAGQPSPPPSPEIASRAAPEPQPGTAPTPLGGPAAPPSLEPPRAQSTQPPATAHPPSAPGAVALAEPPPAAPPAAHRGGSFLWPVRGHILENYGTGPDGTHNDGINIAAPRGAPVQATDAGVVAYAGNELRGYGNLVLIKHPNGWISAYAHCDLILVKAGQKVVRGQVIARVGSTGNVSEPQLHFELRRGKQPVNPRDYLAPLPSAATRAAEHG